MVDLEDTSSGIIKYFAFQINEREAFQEYYIKRFANKSITDMMLVLDTETLTYELLFKYDGISFEITKTLGIDDLFLSAYGYPDKEAILDMALDDTIHGLIDGVRVSKTVYPNRNFF
jgi:hypothetical protein